MSMSASVLTRVTRFFDSSALSLVYSASQLGCCLATFSLWAAGGCSFWSLVACTKISFFNYTLHYTLTNFTMAEFAIPWDKNGSAIWEPVCDWLTYLLQGVLSKSGIPTPSGISLVCPSY